MKDPGNYENAIKDVKKFHYKANLLKVLKHRIKLGVEAKQDFHKEILVLGK